MASSPEAAAPSIRRRSRSGLKAFRTDWNAETLFPAADAKHDRIKLRVRLEVDLPPHFTLQDYAEAIDNRTGGLSGDIFRVEFRSPLDVKISTVDRWLFSLHGILHRQPANGRLSGTLDLDLNPTRFAAYQTAPYDPDIALTLFKDPDQRAALQALTLDVGDNILYGREHLGGSTFTRRSQQWRGLLDRYVEGVLATCEAALAPEGTDITANSLEVRSINQCECYWEVELDQAALAIREIARRVHENDPQAQIRSIRSADINAAWLDLALANKIHLRIYAKCSNRLRFEVCYTGFIPQELSRSNRPTSGPVTQRLMDLRVPAAARLGGFWMDYRNSIEPVTDQMQMVDFISRFNANTPEEVQRELLTLLAANRSIIASQHSGAITPAVCNALRRAGILEPSRHRARGQVYRIARRYRAVFEAMFGDPAIVADEGSQPR